jgi:hypothetical protein
MLDTASYNPDSRAPLESRFSKRRILKKALTQLRSKRCIKKM